MLVGSFIVPHPPLIIPDVGKGQEREIQKTIDAYKGIARRISQLKPDTIIVSSPHSIMYSDYLHISPGRAARGDFGSFGVPEVKMTAEYDEPFVNKLSKLAGERGIYAGILGEKKKFLDHGTMVPLYFVNQFYQGYKLVRLSISGLSPITHYRYGKCIAEIINNSTKKYVYIASGDLSHRLKEYGPYGLTWEGVKFDQEITQAFKKGDFLEFLKFSESFCEKAGECGLRSFIIMAGVLDGKAVKSELLSYEGPFGVGYGVAAFTVTGEDKNRCFDKKMDEIMKKELTEIKNKEDPYVKLARESLEYYLKNRRQMKRPDDLLPELLGRKAGVFVSLKKEGHLRGCIGTTGPTTDCIADEIIQNAVSAGTKDYRFEPVRREELPWLVYDVDVLNESEPISSLHDLDVKRYGVIVSYQGRRGLLLPNLEGVDTPKQQVSIALKKGNISPEEPYKMERFEVVRHL